MMVTAVSDSYVMTEFVSTNIYYTILVSQSGCQSQTYGFKVSDPRYDVAGRTHPAIPEKRRVEGLLDAVWLRREDRSGQTDMYRVCRVYSVCKEIVQTRAVVFNIRHRRTSSIRP